jgi:ABC-type protease/lipase transport system fused ATPase/permease subunit
MLRCEGLTQTYLSGGRELTVLKDITFTLEDSGFLAIVGPSAAGRRPCWACWPVSTARAVATSTSMAPTSGNERG